MTPNPRPAAAFAAIRAARQPGADRVAIAERLRQELVALDLLEAAKGYMPTVAGVDYRWAQPPSDLDAYDQRRAAAFAKSHAKRREQRGRVA